MAKRVLMVVTSHATITPEKPTGIWLSEFSEPYTLFRQQGYEVTVASIRGGKAPVDPRSLKEPVDGETRTALQELEATIALRDVPTDDFDAIFLPGGHGTMYDLPGSEELAQTLRSFYETGRVIGAVCHGPAGLVGATLSDGTPLVTGKRVTGFTNEEETAAGYDQLMPFLLEDRLKELDATFVAAPMWADHIEVDGRLITGQNPQSSVSAAKAVIRALEG
ncbi:MAG: type 1 glutamine amidotransferase domain-containing protein [Limnochordales bacterium]|nr:type 1 glutamine amidotransferase domain-containing protein [Limnochordales bacterium]